MFGGGRTKPRDGQAKPGSPPAESNWFQVTHFPVSPPTGMPGCSFGNQDCEALSPQLHALLFCKKALQCFEARLLLCPAWSQHLDCGLSLAHNGCLFPNHRREVDAPGHPLRYHAGTFIEPVRPIAPLLLLVGPRMGRLYTIDPLLNFVPAFSAAASPPLPSVGFLCPPRIAALGFTCR